jgi:hypothetical protein
VGKTAIALEYAHAHKAQYFAIFTFNANTADELNNSARDALNLIIDQYRQRWSRIQTSPPPAGLCQRIAWALGMFDTPLTNMDSLLREAGDEQCAIERFMTWLPQDMPWLLILDDYDRAAFNIDSVLERSPGGHVLITSQHHVPYRADQPIDIAPEMEHDKAMELLGKVASPLAYCCGSLGTPLTSNASE